MSASSSSPSSLQAPLPLPPPPPPKPPSSRRPPPPCWAHEETLALIESYRDKWNSLRRGNLRAADWQSVADSVADRCGQDPPSKTATQCRHKVEKLRKRYRAEKRKHPNSSAWIYFRLMDSMEIGPVVVKSSASSPSPAAAAAGSDGGDSSDDDVSDDYNNTRSIHHLMSNGSGGGGGGLRFKIPTALRSKMVPPPPTTHSSPSPPPLKRKMSGGGGDGDGGVGELAAAMRMLTDGYVRMERLKMESAKEMEKRRMEMELKRTELILKSYRNIVDSVRTGSSGDRKRARSETRHSSPET